MDSESQRLLKQTFLKEEILDSGYNPHLFIQFMNLIKEDGSNIDNWTLTELKRIIGNFKQKFQPIDDEAIIQHMEDMKQQQNMQQKQILQEQQDQLEKELTQQAQVSEVINPQVYFPKVNQFVQQQQVTYNKEEDEEEFNTTAMTKKIQPIVQWHQNIFVDVKDPEVKQGGWLFGSQYVVYKIETSPYNWKVFRRYSDFKLLREYLIKQFPSNYFPPVPQRKSKKAVGGSKIDRRIYFIKILLNTIVKRQELFQNQFVIDFLKVSDDKYFDQKKKESEAQKLIQKVEDMSTMEGILEGKITKKNEIYHNYIKDYVPHAQILYHKLKKQIKQLMQDFQQVISSISLIGDSFANLYNLTNELNQKLLQEQDNVLSNLYVTINNSIVEWGNLMADQTNTIQNNLYNFIKFQYKEAECLQDIIKQRYEIMTEFEKYKQKLNLKKEKLFIQGDISKWEISKDYTYDKQAIKNNKAEAFQIMCTRETQQEQNLRDAFACYNQISYQQFQLAIKQKCDRYKYNFIQLSNDFNNFGLDMHRMSESLKKTLTNENDLKITRSKSKIDESRMSIIQKQIQSGQEIHF